MAGVLTAPHGWHRDYLRQEWRRSYAAVPIYRRRGGSAPFDSAIIDAELVACDGNGNPNFYDLMRGASHGCCAYCFDLLELDGRSLVAVPLEERRHLLRRLLKTAGAWKRRSVRTRVQALCPSVSAGDKLTK
jgi:ATP-dependent DNA ligase